MKTFIIAANILLSSVALAQPHRHRHLHPARHERREDSSPVVWVTDIVSVVKTVEMTTTIWVSPDADPTPTPSPTEFSPQESHISSAIADKIFQTIPTLTASIISPSATEDEIIPLATHVVPAEPSETPQASIPEVHPTGIATKAEEDPSSAPDADAIITTLAAPHVSTIPAAEHAAAAGQCSSESPCSGDITYYDPGVGFGACGWRNSKDEPVVALPFGFMGAQSNGNSLCGKMISIEHDGKVSTAKVVDKCMGCTGFSIDLSNAVFSQLSSLSVGRTSARWWIN